MTDEDPIADIKASGATKRYYRMDPITRSHVRTIRLGLRAGMTLEEIQHSFEKTCASWRPSIRAVHLADVYQALGYVAAHPTRKRKKKGE